jgi:hypothetical protein
VSEDSVHRRPYFFELFTLINLAIISAVTINRGFDVVSTFRQSLLLSWYALPSEALIGIAIRLAVAAKRGEARAYLRRILTAGWLTDTLRLIVFAVLMVHTYGWIKLTVPVFHPRLFDAELWDLDQHLFLGYSPTVFLLTIFRRILPAFDWSYANIFFASLVIGFTYFLSAPDRRLRVAFADGNSAMWITGAWLYLAIPSIGPAYRFPDVWLEYNRMLPVTQHFQLMLIRNYQAMLRLAAGGSEQIMVIYGVAAFPSLHVAFQTYAFLWMRKLWRYGEFVFGFFLFVIFLGSMVTGWHYLVDGVAGMVLAALCYWGARRWAFPPPSDR